MKIPPNSPIEVSLKWDDKAVVPVGRLAQADREIVFEYDQSFLASPLPISPLKLPVQAGVQGDFPRFFDGLPGVFNDSLPDGWGRLLIDRRARRQGVTLSPLDRLAIVGEHGIGALTYRPTTLIGDEGGELDLDVLAESAVAVLEGEPAELLDQLIGLGGSPQGARPKAMINWSEEGKKAVHGARDVPAEYKRFLVKFRAAEDPIDVGGIEYAYALMAAAAGIRTPEPHLFKAKRGPGYFGVERFDYDGPNRLHVHTLSGLIDADHRSPALDYDTILAATRYLTKNDAEALAQYRLMAFNVLAHNRDDHSKQFSFVMNPQGAWATAPAYDLTFSVGPNGEHSTTVGGEGRAPGEKDMLKVADKSGIKKTQALEIIEEVRTAVAKWPQFAKEAGLKKTTTSEIQKFLNRK
jgi:serine/threonine-protein kinase HipA